MSRRDGHKRFRQLVNKGNHMRKRTTRGYRLLSKFKKYKWYDESELKKNRIHRFYQDGKNYFFNADTFTVYEEYGDYTVYKLKCKRCPSKDRCLTIFLGFCNACIETKIS